MNWNWQRFMGVVLIALTVMPAQAFYNPTTGRWLNRDPLGEAAFYRSNWQTQTYREKLVLEASKDEFATLVYSFGRNAPLSWIDIDGGRLVPTDDKEVGDDIPLTDKNRRSPPSGMDLITVKPCTIKILYGHNWEGDDRFKLGGFQNVWNIVANKDTDPKGCAYAGVITCNAHKVPNEIPLPGYSPVRTLLPINDRSADDDLARQLVVAMKAAEAAALSCCSKSPCGCKKIKIVVESYGLTIGERLMFPTLSDKTIECPKKPVPK